MARPSGYPLELRRRAVRMVAEVCGEPGQVVLGQPIVQRRRQQQNLMWVKRPKPLVYCRCTPLRPILLGRLDLE